MKRWSLIFLCLSVGCAESIPETKLSLSVAAFKAGAAQAEGVGIGVQPITAANIRKFHDLNNYTVWYEGDSNTPTKASPGSGQSSSTKIKRVLLVPLLPFPSAKIRIMNQSGHPLPLTALGLALKDAAGATFPAYTDVSKLQARVWAELTQAQRGLQKSEAESQLMAAIGKLPYLDVKRTMANGETWTGYVAFDLTPVGDVDAYLRSAGGLQVVASNLGEVPELRLPLEKTNTELELMCPVGQRDPNLNRCRLASDNLDDPNDRAAHDARTVPDDDHGAPGESEQ